MTDTITHVPLSELYLHPLNPRKHHAPEEIAAKAESLRTVGQIHNLACYRDPEREGLGVVAGGYRLLGFQALEADTPGAVEGLGNVAVMVTDDPLTAEAWAVAENVARSALEPAEEIRAYGRMARHGNSPALIARAFCTTEGHVKRRLKLSALPEPVLDALAAREISLGVAEALTTAAGEAQALEALDSCRGRDWSQAQVRSALHQGEIRATDRRAVFVGLDDYEAWDGPVTRDLFSDNTWLGDEPLLDRMFATKLEIASHEAAAEGWGFVWTTTEVYPWDDARMKGFDQVEPEPVALPEADAAEFERLSEMGHWQRTDEEDDALEALEARARGAYTDEQLAATGIMLSVNFNGKLVRTEGLMKPQAAAADDGEGGAAETTATPAPDMPEAVKADLRAIALRARQTAMVTRTELALDLLAFQLSHRTGWGDPLALTPQRPPAEPTARDGLAEDARLAWPEDHVDPTAKHFAAFQAKGKKHRNEVLTRALARLLQPGRDSLAQALNLATEVTPRAIWRPSAKNLFGRVRGGWLDALIAELLHDADEKRLKAFRAMKVKDKAAELDGLFNDASVREAWGLSREQGARLDAWLPPEIADATLWAAPAAAEAAE